MANFTTTLDSKQFDTYVSRLNANLSRAVQARTGMESTLPRIKGKSGLIDPSSDNYVEALLRHYHDGGSYSAASEYERAYRLIQDDLRMLLGQFNHEDFQLILESKQRRNEHRDRWALWGAQLLRWSIGVTVAVLLYSILVFISEHSNNFITIPIRDWVVGMKQNI